MTRDGEHPEADLDRTQALDRDAVLAGGPQDATVQLSEERLRVGTEREVSGAVRARKEVDVEQVRRSVERGVEHADVDRTPALAGDSGKVETLPDGSMSIPVFEEQLVVEKRLVVRERIIVRKHTVFEEHVVEADLRRERLEVETEGDVVLEAGDDVRPGAAPR